MLRPPDNGEMEGSELTRVLLQGDHDRSRTRLFSSRWAAPSHRWPALCAAEFGYWIITSAWNIQREWGPFDAATGEPHAEWKLVDRAAMERELPSALALLARTADRVLVPPTSDATPATPHLAGLG